MQWPVFIRMAALLKDLWCLVPPYILGSGAKVVSISFFVAADVDALLSFPASSLDRFLYLSNQADRLGSS